MVAQGDAVPLWPLRRAYRIEHPATGLGPFNHIVEGEHRTCRNLPHRDVHEREGPYAMPLPWDDHWYRGTRHDRRSLNEVDTWRVAFTKVSLLVTWFAPCDLVALAGRGFVFRVLGVAWTYHTLYATQIVYDRHEAVVLRTLPIVDTRTWFAQQEQLAQAA